MRRHMPGCGCCGCKGFCSDIEYSSMDIELDGTGYCGPIAHSFVLNSKLNEFGSSEPSNCRLLELRSYGEICAGYGAKPNHAIEVYIDTLTTFPSTDWFKTVRVSVALYINNFGEEISFSFRKTITVADCEELLTPIALDMITGSRSYQTYIGTLGPFWQFDPITSLPYSHESVSVNGLYWNLNL